MSTDEADAATVRRAREGGYDVIVVGGGNAAFCAALAARDQGA
jgi:thioredoxin reductase